MRPLLIVVLATLWLGAALLLAGAVAPAAFAVLPSPALAGLLVGRLLPVVFISGLLAGAAVTASEVLGPPPRLGWTAIAAALVWGVACAIAQFVVTPRMERLRAAVAGPIDGLATADAHRLAFGRLHGTSVALLGAGMIAAAIVAALAGVASRSRP